MSPQYPQNIATVVITAYLIGTTHFCENQPQESVLGQLFCYAIRNALQEEIQGNGRSRMEVISALADQVRPQILPETYQAFCSLSQAEFDEMFDAIIEAANESKLSLSELLNGLSSVNQILEEFSELQAKS